MEEPLTEQRIQDLFDALERFGGDLVLFRRMALAASYGRAAPPELSGLDAVRLSNDLARLEMIWQLTAFTGGDFQPGGAGAGAAFASFDLLAGAWSEGSGAGPSDEEGDQDDANSLAQALAAMVRLTASMSPPGTTNVFATFTPEEMAAVAAHAERIGAVMAQEQAAAMELQAQSEARAAGLARIHEGDPEAREWLRANGQEAPLAGNRFDAAEALAFVDELYAAGAERVVVASESIVDDEHELSLGGPYADTLKVHLPPDPSRRAALFAIAAREAREEGFDPEPDTGQEMLVFWWD